MEENDIERLFLSVAEDAGQATDEVREVFALLVKTTLKYRDDILASKGITVTVEDVRVALDWLVPAMSSGILPQTDDKLRLDLLKLWLEELKLMGNPKAYIS
jgi:hypothetical protein